MGETATVMQTTDSLAGSVLWKAGGGTYHDASAIDMRGTRLAQCAGVNRDTLGFVGASALATVGLVVFLFGPLPIAEGLYRAGLWRRLTPDEVREQFGTKYHKDLLRCSKGVNGWDYICELDKNRFYDKLGVMVPSSGLAGGPSSRPVRCPTAQHSKRRDRPGSNACGAASADVFSFQRAIVR